MDSFVTYGKGKRLPNIKSEEKASLFPVPIWASVTRMTNTESASVPENTSYPWN